MHNKGQQGIDFFVVVLLEKALFWIIDMMMDFFFLQTHTLLLFETSIDGLEFVVDYCDVFISCLESNSDGTHSL